MMTNNKFDSTKNVNDSQVYLRKHTSMRTKVSARWSNLSSAADNFVTKSMKTSKALEKEIDDFLKQPKTPYNQAKVKSLSPHRDSLKGRFVQRAVIGTSQDIKDAEQIIRRRVVADIEDAKRKQFQRQRTLSRASKFSRSTK